MRESFHQRQLQTQAKSFPRSHRPRRNRRAWSIENLPVYLTGKVYFWSFKKKKAQMFCSSSWVSSGLMNGHSLSISTVVEYCHLLECEHSFKHVLQGRQRHRLAGLQNTHLNYLELEDLSVCPSVFAYWLSIFSPARRCINLAAL